MFCKIRGEPPVDKWQDMSTEKYGKCRFSRNKKQSSYQL